MNIISFEDLGGAVELIVSTGKIYQVECDMDKDIVRTLPSRYNDSILGEGVNEAGCIYPITELNEFSATEDDITDDDRRSYLLGKQSEWELVGEV